jgi:transposase-like protein
MRLVGVSMRSPAAISELARGKKFEGNCALYLAHLRWPDAVLCIRCGGNSIRRFGRPARDGMTRDLFECTRCRYQFSATTGTMFHNSRLPLTKWFLAIQRICAAETRVAAKQLERELAVSYETARKMNKRIRMAMDQDEQFRLKFSGIGEIWSPVSQTPINSHDGVGPGAVERLAGSGSTRAKRASD